MKKPGLHIESFSPHLFWDVDKRKLQIEKDMAFIVSRTLDYGIRSDWDLLTQYFTILEIAEIAIQIRALDPKSLAFISALSKIPKEQFRCYSTKQLMPQHWDY